MIRSCLFVAEEGAVVVVVEVAVAVFEAEVVAVEGEVFSREILGLPIMLQVMVDLTPRLENLLSAYST